LEQNGYDPSSVDTDLLPCGLSHIKMFERRVAPATVVAWQSEIGRAEVCGSYGYRCSFQAPFGVCFIIAHDFVALPTRSAIVK